VLPSGVLTTKPFMKGKAQWLSSILPQAVSLSNLQAYFLKEMEQRFNRTAD
jgi:hypothetical protein